MNKTVTFRVCDGCEKGTYQNGIEIVLPIPRFEGYHNRNETPDL